MLFYRGSWSPYCDAQLRAFQRAKEKPDGLDIAVVALPVGYGADTASLAATTGAFVNPDPVYVQSTGFALGPEGKVIVSVYSSGVIGRLVPEYIAAWSLTSASTPQAERRIGNGLICPSPTRSRNRTNARMTEGD